MKNRLNFARGGLSLTTLIIVQLLCCRLWGLAPNKTADRYLIDQWDISAGIPANTIAAITQTPDGYLWIATLKGLVRFDGLTFQKEDLSLPETAIPLTLHVDKQGHLWVGTNQGLTRYDSQSGRAKTFTEEDGITGDGIRRIEEDMHGNLWVSFTASHVNRFSEKQFTAYDPSHGLDGNKINAILEDQKGNLLFGSREKGIFIYKDGKFSPYPIPGLEGAQVIAMHEDREAALWIGTNNGLFRKTGKRVDTYTTADGLSDNYITDIKEDSERNLWVGSQKGLNRINKKQDGSITFESLLEEFTIICLFEDREKSLWAGTYKSGLKRLKDGKFITYAPLEAHPGEFLFSLFEDPVGDIRIGTFGGKLFRCRGKRLIETEEPAVFAGTGIAAVAADAAGNLWLGTNGKGIFQRTNGAYRRFTTKDGLADNLVTSIFRDSRDNLWFSTFAGVSVRRSHSGIIESFKTRDGLSGKIVHNVIEDRFHNIWIAADKGITVLKDGQISKEKPAIYLPDVPVTCILEERSANRLFWVATRGSGLKRLNVKDNSVISYTTAEGMTTNVLYQVLEDHRGYFWMTGDSGILRVGKDELNDLAAGKTGAVNCTSFGTADGMKSIEFDNVLSTHSVLKTGDRELWFITKKGISIVSPAKVRINTLPPPVVIEKVIFDGETIPLNKEAYTCKGVRDFRFRFTAPTFLSPEKITFKYRLDGFDEDWLRLAPGRERAAGFKELKPGSYTFRVTACNAEGIWNESGDSFTFILKSHFYQTLLFKIIVFLLTAAIAAAALYILKKGPLMKKEKYKGSALTPQFAEECIKKLKRLMEEEKIYDDADISLQSLAEKVAISPHLLSRILNEKLNRNFADFINFYRIEEAKRLLQSPKGAKKKISTIAFDVGFNTQVAFYTAFKKYTGKTPAQYKKKG